MIPGDDGSGSIGDVSGISRIRFSIRRRLGDFERNEFHQGTMCDSPPSSFGDGVELRAANVVVISNDEFDDSSGPP